MMHGKQNIKNVFYFSISTSGGVCAVWLFSAVYYYFTIPLTRVNWDGEHFGYAENPDNWIFLFLKIGYIGRLNFGSYYLQWLG
jgi:hypothetical protein